MKAYLITMFIILLFKMFSCIMTPDDRLDDWQQVIGIIFYAGLAIWTGCVLF